MLKSDHRELRNSSVKLMWEVVGGGGMRANTNTADALSFLQLFVGKKILARYIHPCSRGATIIPKHSETVSISVVPSQVISPHLAVVMTPTMMH